VSGPDTLLPCFDVETVHGIDIDAPTSGVFGAVRRLDLSESLLIRLLFRLRGIRPEDLTQEGLRHLGFRVVLERPDRALALGIIGRFWTASGTLVDFEPSEFSSIATPGYAKALWYFELDPLGPGRTHLRTVTRVSCADPVSRRRFRAYWMLAGPFSSLVRVRTLRLVKAAAEMDDDGKG
jgi:hypothetical protein